MNWIPPRRPGAPRRRWPAVLLTGILALVGTGVAMTAGHSRGGGGSATYRDRVVGPAGGASSFGAMAVPSGPDGVTSESPAGAGGRGSTGRGAAGPTRGEPPTGAAADGRTVTTTAPPAKNGPGPRPTTPSGAPASETAAPQGWRMLSPAPIGGRIGHTAAWTGREMVVWGGQSDLESPAGNDGAAYDPAANRWRLVAPAPLSGRSLASAFWTGREVLVWGGLSDDGEILADGAAWDPAANRWRRMADFPLGARDGAAVAWAGDGSPDSSGGRLVVWGGVDWENGHDRNDGAAYDPATDHWTPMARAPLSPRGWSQAGWTGSRLVISGGISSDGAQDGDLADSAAWDPATGSWAPVAARPAGGACTPEEACVVVWIGARMLLADSGLAYDPAANRWNRLSGFAGQDERWTDESTVWTGSRLITWGGDRNQVDDQGVAVTGGAAGVVYDPAADRWRDLEAGPLASRAGHTTVWTGQDMLIWGGSTTDEGLADGAAYRPVG